ncbi:NAD(P)-binding protein [Xylariaceae sp. FL0255]|nr:NAD(P)-binding protein [Xylariaceae sp. FL0255]
MAQQISFDAPPLSRHDVDLTGKTVLVTGANGDLGLECSRQLLQLGLSKLILAVRDEVKGAFARDILLADLEPDANRTIEVWKVEYASYELIVAAAHRTEQLTPRLDIAIINAGVARGSFSTNYLSSILLLILLIDVFKRAAAKANISQIASGRIVLVSSDTAAWTKFSEKNNDPLLPSFDDKTAKWDKFERYATSKLIGQLFLTELAKRVPPSLAIVNCVNPRFCRSAMGARGLVHAAVKQDEKSHGRYVADGKLRPMAPFVYSLEAVPVIQRLWDETMTELSFAGVHDILAGLV